MKKIILPALLAGVLLAGCKKHTDTPSTNLQSMEQDALNNFSDGIAIAQYTDLEARANQLHQSVMALDSITTDANLAAARTAWKTLRQTWERCEGFLIGPVEDGEYDPHIDTWPTNFTDMDTLLNSTHTLTVADIESFDLSLRGFHPLEYMLWGQDGARTAADLTPRQKDYMMSLVADIHNNCSALLNEWLPTGGNYAQKVTTAGESGNTVYTSKQQIFLAIADGLIDICTEVGEGKMQDPVTGHSAQLVESPYSGNSTADFRNNIFGLQQVYLGGSGVADPVGLNDLVAANNTALDNKLQSEMTAAINSFDNITLPYGQAIFTQVGQIQATQAALATLKATLETELKPWIVQYVK